MSIEIVKEMLDRHSDEEVIAYLSKIMNGVVQNYGSAIKVNQPQILFGSLGDITLASEILKAMKHRNEQREAQRQSMVQ